MFRAVSVASLIVLSGLASAPAASAEEIAGQVPAQFRGTWGADCSAPQMRFDETTVVMLADGTTGTVTKSVVAPDMLEIHYDVAKYNIRVIDKMRIQGDQLLLVETWLGNQKSTWNKKPWQRCGEGGAPAQNAAAGAAGPLSLESIRFSGEQPAQATEDWLANIIPEMAKANGGAACEANRSWHWPQEKWQAKGVSAIIQDVAALLGQTGAAVRKVEGGPDNILFVRADPAQQGPKALMLTFYLHEKTDLYLVACETSPRPA